MTTDKRYISKFNFTRPYRTEETSYNTIDYNCEEGIGWYIGQVASYRKGLGPTKGVKALTNEEKRSYIAKILKEVGSSNGACHQSVIDEALLESLQSEIDKAFYTGAGRQRARRLLKWFASQVNFFSRHLATYCENFDTQYNAERETHALDEYPSPNAKLMESFPDPDFGTYESVWGD